MVSLSAVISKTETDNNVDHSMIHVLAFVSSNLRLSSIKHK